ncbi:MAG: hypothetical protein AAFX50_13695, partial [Acidobacteriota bacterium]
MAKFTAHLRQTALLFCLACLFVTLSAAASPGSADSDPIPSKMSPPNSAAERAQYGGVRSSASSSADAYGSSVPVHASWPMGAAPRLEGGSQGFADPSFEGGSPSTDWMETSSGGFAVICDDAFCGVDAPRSGSWFAWFGGVAGPETSSVSQSALFDLSDEFLRFWLRVDGCDQDDSNTDLFTVTLDGTIIYQ